MRRTWTSRATPSLRARPASGPSTSRRVRTTASATTPLGPSPKSPGAFVDLRSLFPEKAIAAAVAATPLGKQAEPKAGPGLPDIMYDLAALGRQSPNCFLPGPDTTWSFAITASRASAVPVALGLEGQSNCRTKLTVLHLSLPKSRLASGPQILPPAGLPGAIVEIGALPKQ